MLFFHRFSDYCYLIDESTGCYDTRQNRMCIVINANIDEEAFSNGKKDSSMIEKTMKDLTFSVRKFQKEKNETHTILMKKIKEGTISIDYTIYRLFQFSKCFFLKKISYGCDLLSISACSEYLFMYQIARRMI